MIILYFSKSFVFYPGQHTLKSKTKDGLFLEENALRGERTQGQAIGGWKVRNWGGGAADQRWEWIRALQVHEGLSGGKGLRMASGGPMDGNNIGTESHVAKSFVGFACMVSAFLSFFHRTHVLFRE